MPRTKAEPSIAASPAVSRRERKQRLTRQAILEAAIRMFSEQGFDGPTIDQIAAATDIGKGTFYNYFSSKEEILVAYMVEVEIRTAERLTSFAEASGRLDTIFGEYMRDQFRIKAAHFSFVQVFLATLIRHGPQMMNHIIRMQKCVDPPLYAFFTRLKERKLIKASADVHVLVHTLKCIQLGVSCLWAMTGPSTEGALQAFAVQITPFVKSIERKTA